MHFCNACVIMLPLLLYHYIIIDLVCWTRDTGSHKMEEVPQMFRRLTENFALPADRSVVNVGFYC